MDVPYRKWKNNHDKIAERTEQSAKRAAENVSDWFEIDRASPYMLLVAPVKEDKKIKMSEDQEQLFGIDKLKIPRSQIPAATHVDYSARVQTVHEETNPRFHKLLDEFYKRTDCPVLVNTSFNVRGEPIVGSPTDAFRCFMGTGIEVLAIGNAYLRKEEQDANLVENYEEKYDLD